MQISPPTALSPNRPPAPLWAILGAFAVVYLGYGLNFLAIKVGVETLPAFLFAGSHVSLAGLLLLTFLAVGRQPLRPSLSGFRRAALAAAFLFVGGVGLVTEGEKLGVSSGVAAIIKASVPLWVTVFEALRPRGERLGKIAIVGLLSGAGGVVWLVLPRLGEQAASASPTEPLGIGLLVLSALLFAIGALLVRHCPPSNSSVLNSAWMMVFGGVYLLTIGASFGEVSEVQTADFTESVVGAFLFLLFVHSLAAFSAMNWLLAHLPAAIVTTKFYVSPAIAVFAGWLILHESISLQTLASLGLILGGVGFTLWAQARKSSPSSG